MAASVILDEQGKKEIRSWLGKKVKFNTLYRLTRDGVNAAKFHELCNGRSPTLTVGKTANGYVFGGYTSLAWRSTNAYQVDPNAFLFSLVAANAPRPLKIGLTNANGANAIYDHVSYGPTFGNNHDLFFFNAPNQVCATNIGAAYVAPAAGAFALTGAQNGWVAAELEVIDVSQEDLSVEWRVVDWSENTRQGLKNWLEKYEPRYAKIVGTPFTNVLVIGGTGAGKSTFLNTIASAMLGRISAISESGRATDSLTLQLLKYDVDGIPKMRLWDTKGWSATTYKAGEMVHIIDGNVPHGFPLQNPITPDALGFIATPKFSQKVHVVVVLVGADVATDAGYITRIREFRDLARTRGVRTVIGLTKIDLVEKIASPEGLVEVFKSAAIKDLIDKTANATGTDPNYIIPLKGYCVEYDTNLYGDILALLGLRKILEAADDFFMAKYNTIRRKEEDSAE